MGTMSTGAGDGNPEEKMARTSNELRSLITADGQLRLSLQEVEVGDPGPNEVVIRVEAAPINPSDLAVLIGAADTSTATVDDTSDAPVTHATIPPRALSAYASRVGKSIAVGNEGAGTVVEAGTDARHLLGRTVSVAAGRMYTEYRKVPAQEVLVLPEHVTALQGASALINPMTALAMLSTMRLEGHTALVHTAAASSLGRMLNRLCLADGVEIVNVVRRTEQASILRELGAGHIVDSTDPDFTARLTEAVGATGATLAFDAVGGGPLAGQILMAMESACLAASPPFGPYGSPTHKQVYVYGRLDPSPTTVPSRVGMAWGVGGWLLTYHLQRIGAEATRALRERVAAEITTTFATQYSHEISLAEALRPEAIRGYGRMATRDKYVIVPAGGR